MSAAITIEEYFAYSLLPPDYRIFHGISLPIWSLVDSANIL